MARSERTTGVAYPANPTGPMEPPPQAYAAFAVPGPGYPVNNPLGWAPTSLRPSTVRDLPPQSDMPYERVRSAEVPPVQRSYRL
jgi:hypothetical protein